jgi:hypothetical protein
LPAAKDRRFALQECCYTHYKHGDVVFEMLRVYFEEIFKYKTNAQLEHIKKALNGRECPYRCQHPYRCRVRFSGRYQHSYWIESKYATQCPYGTRCGYGCGGFGYIWFVQKAADSAHRLHVQYPAYYSALYMQQLEMMYFLIEPLFERAGAFEAQWVSDSGIAIYHPDD